MKVDKIKILSTFFGIGYLPYFPGTWATLVGIGIYFLLRNNFIIYIFVSALIFTLGLLVCTKAETIFGKKDSHFIVIDEIAAILILLVLTHKLVQHNLFFIMRFFKLTKSILFRKKNGNIGIQLEIKDAVPYSKRECIARSMQKILKQHYKDILTEYFTDTKTGKLLGGLNISTDAHSSGSGA